MNKRREFNTLLGGAATWPLAARAQPRERMRRLGVLLPASASDPEYPTLIGAFLQELQQLGWALGRNLQMDIRWSGGDVALLRKDTTYSCCDRRPPQPDQSYGRFTIEKPAGSGRCPRGAAPYPARQY